LIPALSFIDDESKSGKISTQPYKSEKHLMNKIGSITALALLMTLTITADATVYKTVGPDGKVIYTDQPPADPKTAATLNIAEQPSSPLPASVLKYQEQLAKSADKRLREPAPVRANLSATPTLFSAAWCGYCRKAKGYMASHKITFQEIDIDTESGARAYFEAGGRSGVPMLIVDGRVTRGFSESTYDQVFAKANAK
jgi:glutaredoxin